MKYRIVIDVDADDPQGLRELVAMACEGRGRVLNARVDALEEQARIGDSGAAAAARAQLEAALGRRGAG